MQGKSLSHTRAAEIKFAINIGSKFYKCPKMYESTDQNIELHSMLSNWQKLLL